MNSGACDGLAAERQRWVRAATNNNTQYTCVCPVTGTRWKQVFIKVAGLIVRRYVRLFRLMLFI